MNEIALEANIRRSALVVASPDVAVPLTFGFRRSTIVVPENAREWSADELTRALEVGRRARPRSADHAAEFVLEVAEDAHALAPAPPP